MKNSFSPTSAKKSSVVINTSTVPSVMNTNSVASLSVEEMNRVRDLKLKLSTRDMSSLLSYGDNIYDNLGKITDTVLANTTVKDLDFLGESMANVLAGTQAVNFQSLAAPKSKVPVIGKMIDRVKNVKAKVTSQYNLVSEQISKTLVEVDKVIVNLKNHDSSLGQMYDANTAEYRELQLHTIAAKSRYEEIGAEADAFERTLTVDSDPFDHQQLADARRYLENLDMTISNMEALSLDAYQTAVMIRQSQQNAVRLIDKFGMVKKFTFPNWKKKFAVALIGRDTQRGAELANTIDDANNQLARETAAMVRQTGVAVAKLSQRGVYDLETLEFVNTEFQSGAQELQQIAADGATARAELMVRVQQMKQDLQTTTLKVISK